MYVYVCPLAPEEPTKVQTVQLCPHCLEPLANHPSFVDLKSDVAWHKIINEEPVGLITMDDYFDEMHKRTEEFLDGLTSEEIEGLQFGT